MNTMRGSIYDKNKTLIVPPSLKPIIYDYNCLSDEELNELVYSYSYEGTIVRLYDNEGYKLSTFKKMDAFQCKWGGPKSFGELFLEAARCESLEAFIEREKLDMNYVYMYLILASEQTRVFAKAKVPNVLLLSKALRGDTKWLFPTCTPGTQTYKSLSKGCNPKIELETMIGTAEFIQSNGIIGQNDTKMYWFVHPTFYKAMELRNNIEYKDVCYLLYLTMAIGNSWREPFSTNEKLCRKLYPKDAEQVTKKLAYYIRNLHKAYMDCFVFKTRLFKNVPCTHAKFILRMCHSFYLSDRKANIITKDIVEFIFANNTTNPYFVKKLICCPTLPNY